MKINLRGILTALTLSSFILLCLTITDAQTTSFTYQGKLTDNNIAANGSYQMQFGLFDAPSGGSQIGAAQNNAAVTVTNGVFTVSLNFGASGFEGSDRYLQISVFSTATNQFVALTPRQQITSAPYAVRSLNASSANNAENLGGTAANQFVVTTDSRMTDSRTPAAGSANYIQNTVNPQAANFNIAGEGKANLFESNNGYGINGDTVLTAPGLANYFVGYAAGAATTAGNNNSFLGYAAGLVNTTGSNNTLVGSNSNLGATNLSYAAAFGAGAVATSSNTIILGRNGGQDKVRVPGILDVSGQYNIAGNRVLSVAGSDNLFVGESAGAANTTGNSNAFFGRSAGVGNSQGNNNSFFGRSTGSGNTLGDNNTFIGYAAGDTNTLGNFNTYIGSNARGAAGINNSTAVGVNAYADTSNQIVLGTSSETVLAKGALYVDGLIRVGNLNNNGVTPLCLSYITHFIATCTVGLADEKPDGNTAFLLNSVKEQQTQIKQQNAQIERQETLIDELKKLVCLTNRQADVCRQGETK